MLRWFVVPTWSAITIFTLTLAFTALITAGLVFVPIVVMGKIVTWAKNV